LFVVKLITYHVLFRILIVIFVSYDVSQKQFDCVTDKVYKMFFLSRNFVHGVYLTLNQKKL